MPKYINAGEKLMLQRAQREDFAGELRNFRINTPMFPDLMRKSKGYSTIDADVELVEIVFEAWEYSRNAIGVFCDLYKAFNSISHETLIRTPHYYGVTGRTLDLRVLYLTNRVQKVDVNNIKSSGSVVRMGVPHGIERD
ncbi:hypothetical protein EVAR_48157_1 [Eumeta japonica]|uniref:Uncharacterized protein n=1 Tax=Eumeta variegata TaxID=151549 RepID=A0A4C1WTH6_EUMVA|nr:hypothetical protein EVAR_48157_1 [Eumeta japonica]